MALVTGHNLGMSFGAVDIFEGVTVSIPHRARIALVGPNGSGKTTLLRLLARRETPSEGEVTHAKGLRIGFLPQEATEFLDSHHTVWDEMLTAFTDLLRQKARVEELAAQLEADPENEDLLERYGAAQLRFEQAGGYEYELRIQQVLVGLGFDETDFTRPITQLSGGQKTRALLARLLLENPDLLILDEPTNHLDIRAIEWMEAWIKDFDGALLIVSHDRYFMDSTVQHIWELNWGRVEEYRGNYSAYFQQREARWERADELYEREKERLLKEVDFIKRNMASRGTAQAQGRLKRLSRQLVAIDQMGLVDALASSSWLQTGIGNVAMMSVEEAERRVRSLTRPTRKQHHLKLRLDTRQRSGEKVLMTRDLVIGYHDDQKPLFDVPDITLRRLECAALIGPNGAGKSTFLKTALENLEPLSGEVILGGSVEVGYFAQAHEELNPDNTILEEILELKYMPVGEVRNYLAQFLFTGDDVYKPIAALSGGERGRVALAKLALGGANLLLLDEPTNHLDIPSQEILEQVLADYDGTILLVSHDRYLIRDLATQIWALDQPHRGAETEFVLFEGPYDEYIAWRDGKTLPESKPQPAPEPETSPAPEPEPAQKRSTLTPYQRQQRLRHVEDTIHQLEVKLVDLSGMVEAASSGGEVDRVRQLGQEYAATESRLNALMEEWEDLLVDA